MARFIINGGQQLSGEVQLTGAKNAASKMMIATLLTDEECTLKNFPQIGDTGITGELCRIFGSQLSFHDGSLTIRTPQIKNNKVTSLSWSNRIPILAIGPLLSRTGEVEVPLLGGDKIGARSVDMHLQALRQLGADIRVTASTYQATAKQGLRGARIDFLFPSVGATENVLLASVLAKGRTIVRNAAIEPEIIDLIKMLQKMGAIIELGAHRTIYIDGVDRLRGVTHSVIPDRAVAVSFACLAVVTNSRIKVVGARQDDLITFLNTLRKAGGDYDIDDDGITFYKGRDLQAVEIETDSHPGFMTDWQQPFVLLLTQANGTSVIHETIYDNRFGYIKYLNEMGANIKVFSKCLGELRCRFNGKGYYHSAIINGPTPIRPFETAIGDDLRWGMVTIIGALAAKGQSTISNIEQIERGYGKVDEVLKKLGADIRRA